jgi:dihydrofolate reductase
LDSDPDVMRSWQEAYVAAGPMADEIAKLKRVDGKPIIAHGGGGFSRSLIATGLVDAFLLLVHPVALGGGMPIFTELEKPLLLKLIETQSFPKGAVAQIYRPALGLPEVRPSIRQALKP